MKRVFLIGALALVLKGCVTQHQSVAPSQAELVKAKYEDATKAYIAAEQDCIRGPFRTRVEKVRCINEAENRLKRPMLPHPDLLDVKLATRMAIAEKVDR